MSLVAVLDIGKTNVKLSAVTRDGGIVETLSTTNVARPGPPYLHPDLIGIEDWFCEELHGLARRHAIGTIVACCHGSAGVLVGDDGPVAPMLDYEEQVPPAVDRAYRKLAATTDERGGPIMPLNAHLARQLLWLETDWPRAFARGRWFLGGPQYWSWRLTGVAASELSYFGAQSQLWNTRDRRFLPIVEARGWRRLLPPFAPAWKTLGGLEPDFARRTGLAETTEVLCGIHDSSANFYRYQQAGFRDLAVMSTGTWIVGLSNAHATASFAATDFVIRNSDVAGNSLAGTLAMGGREFALIAGEGSEVGASLATVRALVADGTMALPSFVADDGPFPGSAGKGRIVGGRGRSGEERRALAVLYIALQTDMCLDALGAPAATVLDGTFVRDRLYASLVASLRPEKRTMFSPGAYGTASGAALLADHARRASPAPVAVQSADLLSIPGLDDYRRRWRELAGRAAFHPPIESLESQS